MENRKNYILILIALVLVIAIGLYIYGSKQSIAPTGNVDDTTGTIASSTQYTNSQYRFTLSLPQSWEGYSVVTGKWEGYSLGGQTQTIIETGPMISIRHPLWTQQVPRQDIPIMLFTLAQWNDLLAEKFHIGAAPIGPSELGRNAQYVFALPARYNFAYLPGFEEVDQIIQSKALHTF
ncbi:MAG: hypothetical protein WCK48_02780 [bacterium]